MSDEASAGTDVGRRIAERRKRSGLTVEEAADRAGMAPDYLEYLESSPAPNPTQAALTRLAAALDTSPASLSGAGLNVPPGQRQAAKNAVLETLSTAECRQHLTGGGVGRFLFVQADRGPVAIPVNFAMDGDDVIFRTADDRGVAEGVGEPHVSFDVDHLDDVLAEGWSVLLSGTARFVTDKGELDRVRALHVEPWAGGDRAAYVRLTPTEITGRRIRITG